MPLHILKRSFCQAPLPAKATDPIPVGKGVLLPYSALSGTFTRLMPLFIAIFLLSATLTEDNGDIYSP